jgi:hypothetical protein
VPEGWLHFRSLRESAAYVLGTRRVESTRDRDGCEQALSFALDILDKQYLNYMWNDGKVQVLMATDSIVGAAAAALISIGSVPKSDVAIGLLIGSVVCVSTSLLICLRHAVPRLNSGMSGPQTNVRAQTGITSHKDYVLYHSTLRSMSTEVMFVETARQVYGMAHNNIRSHRLIRLAAGWTMAACICIAGSIASIGISAANRPPSTSKAPTTSTTVVSRRP